MSHPDDHDEQGIRVLVCDDHDLIRQALRVVVNAEPDMEVIGEASDGVQAVELARELRPDAVVMDIEMPGLSGIEATSRIKSFLPRTSILALTVHDSNEYILRILEAGATGYLTKGVISKEVPAAIRSAVSGESILSAEILRKLIEYASRFPDTTARACSSAELTEKEVEILSLAARGCSNKAIGRELSLSENTVKKYMMTIFDKLGVHSRTAAVITAQQTGLLSSDG